jgi:hypothetical protein
MRAKESYELTTNMFMYEKESEFGENRELFRQFFQDYFAWDSLKSSIVNLYISEFSSEEIVELINFYETPLGKKIVLKEPILTAKILRLINKRVQETRPVFYSLFKEKYFDFLRDTTTNFTDENENIYEPFLESPDTAMISKFDPSDCQKFREGKFIIKEDTSGFYIVRKDGIQHEVFDFLNSDMELKVDWLTDCEYNLVFVKNKNKKFSYYETGEIINVKISEIRGNEYDCIVKTNKGVRKSTLIKIE